MDMNVNYNEAFGQVKEKTLDEKITERKQTVADLKYNLESNIKELKRLENLKGK